MPGDALCPHPKQLNLMNSFSVCFIIEKADLRRVELLHLSVGAKEMPRFGDLEDGVEPTPSIAA